jgi:hypothetical protein
MNGAEKGGKDRGREYKRASSSYHSLICEIYDGVSKSFRTGHLEWELQTVQLSATRCSCIAILWVSIVSFAAIALRVASQRVFIVDGVYFVIDSSPETFGYTLVTKTVKWNNPADIRCAAVSTSPYSHIDIWTVLLLMTELLPLLAKTQNLHHYSPDTSVTPMYPFIAQFITKHCVPNTVWITWKIWQLTLKRFNFTCFK